MEDHSDPTYGELIDLLSDAEVASNYGEQSVADILTQKFIFKYPHIPVNRPGRFLDTVRRLAAPTMPSAIGEPKLIGSPLRSYRHRQWVPRTRYKQGIFLHQKLIVYIG